MAQWKINRTDVLDTSRLAESSVCWPLQHRRSATALLEALMEDTNMWAVVQPAQDSVEDNATCGCGKFEVGILQPKMTKQVVFFLLWLRCLFFFFFFFFFFCLTSPSGPDLCLGGQTWPHDDPAVESPQTRSYLCSPRLGVGVSLHSHFHYWLFNVAVVVTVAGGQWADSQRGQRSLCCCWTDPWKWFSTSQEGLFLNCRVIQFKYDLATCHDVTFAPTAAEHR